MTRLTKPQRRELVRLKDAPQPTYGAARARVQNSLVSMQLARYAFDLREPGQLTETGAFGVAVARNQCRITPRGEAVLEGKVPPSTADRPVVTPEPQPEEIAEISKRLHALTSFDGLSARHISYVRNLEKLARVVVDMLGLIESENHDKDYEKLQRDMIRKQLRRALADVLDAG